MATFTFGRDINIHWNGYDIKGPALTVFSIPDQLYEEFEGDLRGAEPTLTWVDTNEFQTLSDSVSVTDLTGTYPIAATATSSGKAISIVSTSASSGYVLTANGAGGVTWSTLPADATGITNIIGTSPISAAVSGSSATISITASYSTSTHDHSGTYDPAGTTSTHAALTTSVHGITDTANISYSTHTHNYQASGTYVNAVIGTSPASVSTASGTSTVSIVAGSINSTHLSATSVGSSQLISQSVGTAKISSTGATSGQVLTADGSGAATFQTQVQVDTGFNPFLLMGA